MNFLKFAKPTLLVLFVFEIASLLILVHIYNEFVSNPQNYTSVAVLNRQAKKINKNAGLSLPEEEENILPKKFLIKDVPFSVQSPDSKWDDVGEESCEEASMIIVDYFWKKKPLDRKIHA